MLASSRLAALSENVLGLLITARMAGELIQFKPRAMVERIEPRSRSPTSESVFAASTAEPARAVFMAISATRRVKALGL